MNVGIFGCASYRNGTQFNPHWADRHIVHESLPLMPYFPSLPLTAHRAAGSRAVGLTHRWLFTRISSLVRPFSPVSVATATALRMN